MKNFDSRTYSINDFLEWDKNNQLELSPKFQRKNVWSDTARSYLMDTIIRGKPIPKIFIRQKLNTDTKVSIREVVDGQQRLRTILSYCKDGFAISKKHNEKFGGLYFSQLNQIDNQIQSNILNYELSVDLLVNMPDSEVLDVFARLNSYAVLLNDQEKIHASHFSEFKTAVEEVAHFWNAFWIDNKILTEQKILRMEDALLVADLFIAMIEGVKSKKQIKGYYNLYEKEFNHDVADLKNKFVAVIAAIQWIFPKGFGYSAISRIHIFYSFFLAIYHLKYRLNGINFQSRVSFENLNPEKVANNLEIIDQIIETPLEDVKELDEEESKFLDSTRRATTDLKVRTSRIEFICETMTI